jgi:hypothetical protein
MASSSSKPDDGRLHIRIDPELKAWLMGWVEKRKKEEHRKINATMVIEGLLAKLRTQEETGNVEQL